MTTWGNFQIQLKNPIRMIYNITTLKSPSSVLGQSSVRAESARTRGGSVKYCSDQLTVLRERQEDGIFKSLLKLYHGLEDRLANAETEEVQMIGDLVCHNIVVLPLN